MDFALTSNDNCIKAIYARRSEKYYCPVCGEQVFFCEGLKVKAYFRHSSGSECEKIIRSASASNTIESNEIESNDSKPREIKGKTLEDLWQMNYRVAIFENQTSGSQFKVFDDQAKIGLISKKWFGFMKTKGNSKTYTKTQVEIYYANEPQWVLKWKLTHKEAEY